MCVCVSHIHLCVHQDFIHLHFIKNKCGLLIPHIDYPERAQKWKHNNLSFETNVSRKGLFSFSFSFFFPKKKLCFALRSVGHNCMNCREPPLALARFIFSSFMQTLPLPTSLFSSAVSSPPHPIQTYIFIKRLLSDNIR